MSAEDDEVSISDEGVQGPSTIKSRKDRPTHSTHVGDVDFFEEGVDEIGDATWTEVFHSCCCHTPQEWAYIVLGLVMSLFFLYFFLLGLELLGTAAKVIGGCTAGSLLGDDTNPIAALMIGLLATALMQSSSTTTSIIVSLVGAESIPPKQAIYMIMGANIGTTVTNTIVALGQLGDGDQLERAFAGATVHDLFNFLTVAVLLPVEVVSGYLFYLTRAMVSGVTLSEGEAWSGPIKQLVAPLSDLIILANKDVPKDVAKGASCDEFYPVRCDDPSNPTQKTCDVGLIGCNKDTDKCPAFFQSEADLHQDQVAGGVCFVVALIILIVCLLGLVTILQRMLLGMSTRIIYKATNINGYLAMIVGAGITVLVQSSSITTSTLTPLVGMGVLHLEQMYPLTLGANIGTTVTSLLASLVSTSVDGLQVALAHLFFNVTGIIIWYPIPFMRRIPMNGARQLGKATRAWKGFPFVYILVMFFLIPLSLLGISSLFEQGTVGFTVLGSLLVVFIALLLVWLGYRWKYRDGRANFLAWIEQRNRRTLAIRNLADDMEALTAKVKALQEHTGLVEEEGDEETGKLLKDIDNEKKETNVDDDDEEEETAAA